MRSDLPLLDTVKVASPCFMSWDDMVGDERARFCQGCGHNVYNLSQMTRIEAEKLLREHEGRLCVRYYQRPDGKVMTRDCPVGLKAVRQAFMRRAAAVASTFAVMFAAVAQFVRPKEPTPTMGMMEPIPLTALPAPTDRAIMGDIAPAKEPVEPQATMGIVAITDPKDLKPEPDYSVRKQIEEIIASAPGQKAKQP